MRRFLLAANLNGQMDALEKLYKVVQEQRPDGLLFAGGISGNGPTSHADKLRKWESFFDALGKVRVFTAVVPGAEEAPLRDFLRLAKAAEVEYPNVHVAHATHFEQGDMAVGGLGGALTETEDRTEDQVFYARTSAEYFIRSLWQADPPYKVLLLSVAPSGELGGEAGNRICGDFIDSYHPSLCVVEGTSQRRGSQRIAHTLIVNPGGLADGCVASLDRSRSRDEQVQMLGI
jgi:Icc-related predicted phosphoesterase